MSAPFSAVQFLGGCPQCPHGPMLAKSSSPVSFVCTAFRRKGDCVRDAQSSRELPPAQTSLMELQSVEPEKRAYCFDCDHLFVSSNSDKRHASHQVSLGITDQLLKMPSFLLRPKTNSHSHSQYFFSLDPLNHLYSIIHQLDIRFVICVGTPRLHEFVQLQRSCRRQSMNSYLLDMDFRLQWFYIQKSKAKDETLSSGFSPTSPLHWSLLHHNLPLSSDTVSLVPVIHSGTTYIALIVTGVQPNMEKLTYIVITVVVVDRLDGLTASSVVVVCPLTPVLIHENDLRVLFISWPFTCFKF
ncbi:hypothetical protein EG68_12298 [Paragonimus skrjabini miyazakii]|uniref:Uncharacterized protein n=1 Tax=Paragonimus skrjabini miyazakii TaxID=59628 RepID=A0A8S9YKM4_9TREM|nr:hypothetical protein EG68_12298 [Paragonimus skrjabini miyazakii]